MFTCVHAPYFKTPAYAQFKSEICENFPRSFVGAAQVMRFFAQLLLAGAVSAWQSAVPLARHGTALRRAAVHAKEEEVVFTFGDADDMSDSTATAIMGEERELTEREKEIARLRAAEKFIQKATGNAKCNTCGYKYKWEEGAPGIPKRTPFELVPDSWSCPNCKSPKAFFAAETIEIAGFEDNQKYGFGTNTWTESQKSTAIFGGLAAFFALFISGYALVSLHSASSISHDPIPSRSTDAPAFSDATFRTCRALSQN